MDNEFSPRHFYKDGSDINSISSTKEQKYRLFYIVFSIMFMLIMITFWIFLFVDDRIIGEFDFRSNYIPFQTHLMSIGLVQLVIFFLCAFGLFNLIISKKNGAFLSNFHNFLGIYYVVFLLLTFSGYLLSSVMENNFIFQLISLILQSLSLMIISFLFHKSKSQSLNDMKSFIGIGIYIGILLSYVVYRWLYLLVLIITHKEEIGIESSLKITLSLVANSLYALIGIALLSTYKELFFNFVLIVIQVGFLSLASYNSSKETIASIVILCFTLFSLILMILKYKKEVLGINNNEEIIMNLENQRTLQF